MESIHGLSQQTADLIKRVPFLRGRIVHSIQGYYFPEGLFFIVTAYTDGDIHTREPTVVEYYKCLIDNLTTINDFVGNGTPTIQFCFTMEPSAFVTSEITFEYKSLDFLVTLLLCTERVESLPGQEPTERVESLPGQEPTEPEDGDTSHAHP